MLWEPIQKELEKRKWSLHRFSVESGIPDGTLRMYKFKGTDPYFNNACKIADALGISLDDLRERKSDKKCN